MRETGVNLTLPHRGVGLAAASRFVERAFHKHLAI